MIPRRSVPVRRPLLAACAVRGTMMAANGPFRDSIVSDTQQPFPHNVV
ncbi:MAG: hypothetical protein OJF49_004694 [Ktedonobacterales bacterium]|nr:MAG: hypothetical protein OJF49_004694 [Ktedonobacterales bacterium]